ncbi:MAG: DUF2231 domain-containing protein [Campylobacterota bacterium]|nr:DUF2231 domain-containing protein [Campylobacterota bacterium]
MMLHPATAHFAMVLPIVAAVFGIAYLIVKTETMSKITSRITLVSALAMIGVWYTGSQAGPQIYDYLSEAGQATLITHKNLGLYLAIALSIVAVIQLVACKLQKHLIQVVAVLLLVAISAVTMFQGKLGGEIVYNHGTPFKSYMIMDSLTEAAANAEEVEDDEGKLEAYEDAIDDIKMLDEEIEAMYGNPPKTQTSEDE